MGLSISHYSTLWPKLPAPFEPYQPSSAPTFTRKKKAPSQRGEGEAKGELPWGWGGRFKQNVKELKLLPSYYRPYNLRQEVLDIRAQAVRERQ